MISKVENTKLVISRCANGTPSVKTVAQAFKAGSVDMRGVRPDAPLEVTFHSTDEFMNRKIREILAYQFRGLIWSSFVHPMKCLRERGIECRQIVTASVEREARGNEPGIDSWATLAGFV